MNELKLCGFNDKRVSLSQSKDQEFGGVIELKYTNSKGEIIEKYMLDELDFINLLDNYYGKNEVEIDEDEFGYE